MKKIILFLTFAALLFAGCAKVQNEEVVPVEGKRHVTLKATVDTGTRVSIDESGYYGWQKGDGIVVLTNQGAVYGTTQSLGITASFGFDLDQNETFGNYAFYPGNPEWVDQDQYSFENGVLRYFLDWEYPYVQDATFMPMLGNVTSDGASFRSMGGVLKVPVTAVPDDATWFRFTVNDKMEEHDVKINGIFSVVDGVISAEPLTDFSGGSNFTNIRLPYDEVERNAIEAFYIPLPVGTYKSFTFSFVEEGLDNYERTIFSKTAEVAGNGLSVGRNEVIVTPTLMVDLPPQPSALSFSSETLDLFPELSGANPVIRFPRECWDDNNPGARISFESEYQWYVEIEGEHGFLSQSFYDEDDNRILLSSYIQKKSSNGDPHFMREGKVTFYCEERNETIEIPVEEYLIFTVRKDDDIVWNNEDLYLPIGQTFTFSTEIQLPSWISMVDDYPKWYIYSDYDETFGFIDNEDGTATVSGLQEKNDAWLVCNWSYYDESLDAAREMERAFYVHVEPYHIAIRYNNKDMYGETIIMEPGDQIILVADPCEVVNVDNAQVTWSVASGDGVVTINNPTSLSTTISSYGSGFATINLHVVAEEEEYDSQCQVFVKPAGEPKPSDYLVFDDYTVTYFPELATNTPKIRIPLNTSVRYSPVAFIPKLPGFSFDCYLADSFLDSYGDPWLGCFYDDTYGDVIVYDLYYDSNFRSFDGLVSTSLIIECKELGVSFSIPVEEYEVTFTFKHENEDVTDGHLTLVSGGDPISLNAIISGLPDELISGGLDCGWWVENGYVNENDEWVYHTSPVLSYSSSAENPLEFTITGLKPGEDYIGFWYEFKGTNNPWFEGQWDEFFVCHVTVTDSTSPSPAPSFTKRASPKTRHSKKRSSQHNSGFDWKPGFDWNRFK